MIQDSEFSIQIHNFLPVRNKKNTILGFTLIELIIVMGLVAFLATMGVVIFGDFNKRQNLNIANNNIQNTLAQAKSFALSHVVNSTSDTEDCDTENTDPALREILVGYDVQFNTDDTYVVREICLQSDGTTEVYTNVSKLQYLPPAIEFDQAHTDSNIRFFVLTGGAGGTYRIQFRETEGDRERAIQVTPEGVIRNVDPI